MSAINPDGNLFDLAPSPQDLLDESLAGSTLGQGAGLGSAASQATEDEPPQEQALDALNEFTQAAQTHFNEELELGVPADLQNAQTMTSELVGGITAQGTEAMAAAAQTLSPESVLSLLQG